MTDSNFFVISTSTPQALNPTPTPRANQKVWFVVFDDGDSYYPIQMCLSNGDKWGTPVDINSSGGGGSGTTNLSIENRNANTLDIASDTGLNATIPAATTTEAGLQSASDKTKLDGIAAGAQVNAVASVAGKTGVVTLTKADVGLGNVDNTSDLNKPISTATQTALDGKDTAGVKTLTPTATDPGNTATNSGFLSWLINVSRGAQTSLSGLGALASLNTVGNAEITDVNASKINAGTLNIARIPTGNTASTVTIGNDARLSDQRVPTDNSVTNAKVSTTAAIAWSKISKTGAVPGDVGAQAASAKLTTISGLTGTTPIRSDGTNGVLTAAEIPNLSATKITSGVLAAAQSRPSNVTYTAATGTFLFTWADGSTQSVDTPIENLFQNVAYDSGSQTVTFTLANGSTTSISLAQLVDLPEIQVATANPSSNPTSGQRLYLRSDNGEYWVSNGTTWSGPFLSFTSAERSKLSGISANAINQTQGDARYRQLSANIPAAEVTGTFLDNQIPATIARDSEVTAAFSAHEAASDPHPQYLTATEANAAYAPITNTGSTNLSITNRTGTTLDITSDTGNDATIPAATTSLSGLQSAADKTKLEGVQAGATANSTDAQLRDRATHTGTQAIGTVTGLQSALDGKQPLDSDLTAIAASGTGAAGLQALAAADAAALRTAAGLDTMLDGKQPLDDDLTAIGNLATTGLIERTGNGTAATRAIGATGAEALAATNDAELRTAAGLGTIATQNADAINITGGQLSNLDITSSLWVTKGDFSAGFNTLYPQFERLLGGGIRNPVSITGPAVINTENAFNQTLDNEAGIPTNSISVWTIDLTAEHGASGPLYGAGFISLVLRYVPASVRVRVFGRTPAAGSPAAWIDLGTITSFPDYTSARWTIAANVYFVTSIEITFDTTGSGQPLQVKSLMYVAQRPGPTDRPDFLPYASTTATKHLTPSFSVQNVAGTLATTIGQGTLTLSGVTTPATSTTTGSFQIPGIGMGGGRAVFNVGTSYSDSTAVAQINRSLFSLGGALAWKNGAGQSFEIEPTVVSTFSSTVPFDSTNKIFAQHTVSGAITFTVGSSPKPGTKATYKLLANGANTPTFTGFTQAPNSQPYANRSNTLNIIEFWYDNNTAWYSITAPAYATPTLNNASLTFTNTNANFSNPIGNSYSSNNAGAFSGIGVSSQQIPANKNFEIIVFAQPVQLLGLKTTTTVEAFSNWPHYIWNIDPDIYSGQSGTSVDSGFNQAGQVYYKLERVSGTLAAYYKAALTDAWIPFRTWAGTNNGAFYVALSTTSSGVIEVLNYAVEA